MLRIMLVALVACAISCSSTERVSTIAIPEDGAPVEYAEFLPRLRTLAWRATEAYYRDRWDELEEATQTLDRAVQVLARAKDVPARVQPELAKRCKDLTAECQKVREAAKARSETAASEHLQRIHVLIRELRSEG